ncbi:E3 ubiquitin-protein ligase TRIM39-like [Perca flavescens]|uniref:E3 ubiquitin-protein ligase TRIM39-like n=1 Tax=Perca flavescens TaxID=8167 RepID=UPI00106E7F13|nr:E3 ubiquitin-protein ligase TRIM39-like [Perca flavescens]
MSAASSLLTDDQILCSISLDVFTDPVTIPCGHNFCKACITDHWDIDAPYQCPNCRKGFNMKPELQVNTLISEMAAKFRRSTQPIPEEVPRDVYSGSKLKTWMFWCVLLCLMGVFMAWMLIETIKKTEKLAEDFRELKQEISELKKRSTEVEQRCVAEQEKLRKEKNLLIETIKEKEKAEKQAEGFLKELKQEISELKRRNTEVEQLYVAEQEKLRKEKNLLIETIKEKEKKEKQAEGFIKDLKQEISELKRRNTEVEQLYVAEQEKLRKEKNLLIETIKEKEKAEKQAEGFIKDLKQEISELKKKTEMDQFLSFFILLLSALAFIFFCVSKNITLQNLSFIVTVGNHPYMSAASSLLTEDQILCSICLDVFTDPVTIPCGHNFCKACITDHWDIDLPYQCPNCKNDFSMNPKLHVNTLVTEMAAKFRQSLSREAGPSSSRRSKKKQTTTEKLAEGFVKDLKQEISELKKRNTEVEQLYVAQQKKLSKLIIKLLPESDLMRVQQYEVDVTLDPDTAYPWLILSDDGKQVKPGDVRKNLPDNPERFDYIDSVLAKQSFSSGRFYYEVQVKRKTYWTLGVARESVNRKGEITLTPQNGYWTIELMDGDSYYALAGPTVLLSLKSRPQKVGVFVDYEEGLVSFYDVDAEALIYSFTGCSFTEKLYPFFNIFDTNDDGKNSAPLIISPVSH